MAKGAIAKQEVASEILKTFGEKAFLYNDGKEIRVNWVEAGEPVQIKIALTASKVAVEQGGDTALPAATVSVSSTEVPVTSGTITPPTNEEKANIEELMRKLGL